MMRTALLIAGLALLGIGIATAQERSSPTGTPATAEAVEEETALPAGEGRSETFGYCTGCHNTALIRRSRLTREQWDGLMDWMSEKHGMNPLEGEFRDTIVTYLVTHFGPARAPARSRNPFLN